MKALSIDELDQDGQFTLFAPSDEAFQALDLEVLAFLRNDMDHYEMKGQAFYEKLMRITV